MDTLVLWGSDDHKNRADALATQYNTTAEKVTSKPRKVNDLESLVFWGHGDPKHFCGLDSSGFVDLVNSWRKKNSKLHSIEMLTCNARHKQSIYTDSFTEQVKRKLTSKLSKLKFKALPVAVTPEAETCDWSILKWHPASATWAYFGGPGVSDTTYMFKAVAKVEDMMPPRGTRVGYARAVAAYHTFRLTTNHLYATKRKLTQTEVDEYNQLLDVARKHTFVMAGTLSSLRWYLKEIK